MSVPVKQMGQLSLVSNTFKYSKWYL